jgi:type IV pilus assembly protein PilB
MSGRIVEVVKRANLLGKEDLLKAVEFSHRDNVPFPLFLLRNGYVEESVLMPLLERELGYEFIDLDNQDIEPAILDCVTRDIAITFRIIPLNRLANNLIVACGDPTNLDMIDKVSARLGSKIKPKLASELAIQRALDKYYVGKIEAKSATAIQDVADVYVISYIERLLQYAAQRKVSDIHFECFESSLRVRLRADGSLMEYAERPRFEMRDAMISRVKIISNLDITERRLPQDGNTKLDVPGVGKLDFRVSCLPTVWGEKIVLRLLDKGNLQLDMTKLGFDPDQLAAFQDAIHKPFGMVVVTGPTGSGKTTTLYSALSDLNRVSDCIVTAEDPVEYTIPGIAQSQVKPDINFTFASALKSFLRQDPDVIMIGEIRDLETADMAMRAALTGHIVLSTLHTNNAPETVERLRNMGVESFTIISALNAVIAQRLVRKVCPKCKVEDDRFTPEELINHGLPAKYVGKFPIFRGEGCEFCNGTGYKGRAAIYEVMTMTEALKRAVSKDLSALELKIIAMQNGMQTLRQSAWKKVAKGVTSLEELLDSSSPDFDATSEHTSIKRSA